MVIKNIGQSYLHTAIVVVLRTMNTADHKVDKSVYSKLVGCNGKNLKVSWEWFQVMR